MGAENTLWSRALRHARRFRAALVVLAVAAYLVAALYPFRWDFRGATPNGASRATDGALRFDKPGLAHTPGVPDWLEAAIHSNSLRIRVECNCENATQSGPARIFTISENQRARNLTIGQDGRTLVVRLRHAGTTSNGIPAIEVPDALKAGAWQEIVVEVTARKATVALDGSTVATRRFSTSPFGSWSSHYGAAIGNERTLKRAWLGSIRALEVTVDETTTDLLRAPDLACPAEISYIGAAVRSAVATRETLYSEPRDLIQNVLGFIPFGLLLVALYPRSRLPWLLLAIFAMSLSMETAQIFAEGRKSSPTDLVTNLLGGAIGLYAGALVVRSRER